MSRLVSAEYPELMHYTTGAGLIGIVTSGSLWATHASFLNDTEEMTHFFDTRLQVLAEIEVRKYAADLKQRAQAVANVMSDEEIEGLIRDEAARLVSIMRRVTLSFNQPHIFSMSGTHEERVRRSGLLSQWRGYGVDGGYAIVFDTLKLEELLPEEAEAYHYQHLHWADVFYSGMDGIAQPSSEDVIELERAVLSGLSILVRGGNTEDEEHFYRAVSSLSCIYKHWGFHEEHEIRVVAIPIESGVAKLAAAAGEAKPQKKIRAFLRDGLPVPYIELFSREKQEAQPARLPIKRVIVGPHRDSASRKSAIEKLLISNGYDCEVVRSEIPYIGR